MKINIGRNQEEGIWIVFDEDVSFKIRPGSPKTMRMAARKAKKAVGTDDDVNKFVDIQDRELWDWILEDWKGVYINEETEAECTIENKLKLIEFSHDHSNFILKQSLNLSNFLAIKKEKEEKN